ncbi:MAG: hypothetical protein ACI861_000787, partial [Paracoccaceae bacterium]
KGDFVSIHFDARGGADSFKKITDAFADRNEVTFAPRIKCGWGEWSLVQATLNAVIAAEAAFPKATHFYMVSGDCMPIKSARYVHEYLDDSDQDYIESFDYFKSNWIKTGMRDERLIYRHYFNERKHKGLFYAALEAQKRFGLKRAIPKDLEIMVGSQWWCLRRKTIEAVLELIAKRRDIIRFFRTTWIPDETFFQTLVRHLVPHAEIDSSTKTFLMFSDYGMPVTFYNDQYDLLLSQDFFFARKISPEALDLKRRLGTLYADDGAEFTVSNEGRKLYQYLAQQGGYGRRFTPRFWERENTLGREREVLILICKKWHVAKRLLASIQRSTNLHGAEFLFDEVNASLPHLGGIENSMEKRTRHRRAMMRMLFDYYETNRMIICLDPNNMDLLTDFYSDRCTTRVLEIECAYDEDYLIGHAKRFGLAGENTSHDTLMRLVPTVRQEFSFETDAIKDAEYPHFYQINERSSDSENTPPISDFLGISRKQAGEIARTDHLFAE